MKDYFNSTDDDTENEAEGTVADVETLSAAIALEVGILMKLFLKSSTKFSVNGN